MRGKCFIALSRWLFVAILLSVACVASAQEKNVSAVVLDSEIDSVGLARDEVVQKAKLHNVLVSYGATVPFHKSMLWQFTLAFDVRIFKNIFVGVTWEGEMQRFLDFNQYTDSLCGSSIELTIKAFSNPLYRKNKFSIGLWGDIGFGRYGGRYTVVDKTNGYVYDDETWIYESYLKFICGLYFKYRGIYATVGYHVNNLELTPYGKNIHHGVFRKPSLHGLSLMIRFGI